MVYKDLKTILMVALVTISIAETESSAIPSVSTTETVDENSTVDSQKSFVSLTADCFTNHTVILHLHTSEPFNGWFYARDHQDTCSQKGSGRVTTDLVITKNRPCGVKFLHKQAPDAESISEILLYVQHDEFVQQVIDEQFLVHCTRGSPHGIVSYHQENINSKSMDHIVTKSISTHSAEEELFIAQNASPVTHKSDEKKFQPRFGIAFDEEIVVGKEKIDIDLDGIDSSDLLLDDDQVDTNEEPLKTKSVELWKPVAVIRQDDLINIHRHPVSGWMELTFSDTSEVIEDEAVSAGKRVNLVIRLKQTKDRDTMISSCAAHGERDNDEEEKVRRRAERGFYSRPELVQKDLTDFRGCSVNTEVLPNFSAAFNSMTGVKKLTTTVPIFKFAGHSKITYRCSVLVCRKNCPVAKCDDINDMNELATLAREEFQGIKIMEKFFVETTVDVIDRAADGHNEFLVEDVAQSSDRDLIRAGSNLFQQNSALHLEVGAAEELDGKTNQVETPPDDRNDKAPVLHEEDQLCLSPSRLVLGFGILLVILLLALVASCMMWMRARSYSRRPRPILSPTSPPRMVSPTRITARVATPVRTSPTTAPILSPRPYFVAPRYIRVMQ